MSDPMQPDPNIEHRRRGRPRVREPLSFVGTRLPPADHDRLVQLANRQEKSLAATVRQLLVIQLRNLR